MIKTSDFIVKKLYQITNAKHVFLLSGGGIMHLLDSLKRSSFTTVPMHHEQACAIASYGYSRAKNCVGICFVTSGPGVTNAITGLAAAWTDSIPIIFISGQVSTKFSSSKLNIRQHGFQEINTLDIVKKITKYSSYIHNQNQVGYELEKSIFLSINGRPGPVWLDIPLDIQASSINLKKIKKFDVKKEKLNNLNPAPKKNIILKVINKLRKARRPLVIMGHGVILANGKKIAKKLINKIKVPIQTTWNSIDLIEEKNSMYFGRANAYGPRYANFIIQNADYILSIGARLGIQHTGYNVKAFGREAFIDMIDLDKLESKKTDLKIDRFIQSDAKKFIDKLHKYSIKIKAPNKWIKYCTNIKKNYPTSPSLNEIQDKKFVDPYFFFKILSNVLNRSATVALGSSGTCFTVSGQVFESKINQTIFHAKGMAAMGFGIPSAIGACFAKNKNLTVTVVGDGGFQLNIQELQTIIHNKLPIKIFVLQNNNYHAIRVTQDTYFNSKYIASSNETGVSVPSFKKIAKAYNFKYSRINNNNLLATKLKKILATNHPEIIEVIVNPKKHLIPKLGSVLKKDGSMVSSPLEDLHPLLDRDEFLKNMLIDPVKY